MNANRLIQSAAVVAMLIGVAPAMAADLDNSTQAPTRASATNFTSDAAAAQDTDSLHPATPQDYVKTAQFTTQAPAESMSDGLHSDQRWPIMERCINQSTPDNFNACLASAFLQDGTGASNGLMPHRR